MPGNKHQSAAYRQTARARYWRRALLVWLQPSPAGWPVGRWWAARRVPPRTVAEACAPVPLHARRGALPGAACASCMPSAARPTQNGTTAAGFAASKDGGSGRAIGAPSLSAAADCGSGACCSVSSLSLAYLGDGRDSASTATSRNARKPRKGRPCLPIICHLRLASPLPPYRNRGHWINDNGPCH